MRKCVVLIVCFALSVTGIILTIPEDAQAIPAFARKYTMLCNACHTRAPRLNTFGERFLENGYQIPGTSDGGLIGKKKFGDLTLGDVTNYFAFRIRGNAFRSFDFTRGKGGEEHEEKGNAPGSRTELGFPQTFSLYTAGTLTDNVGFFVELEVNIEEDAFEAERAFLTFNNLGRQNLAHLRVGRLDPSAFFSYPTHRQQLDPVRGKGGGGHGDEGGEFTAPVIERIPLMPGAFSGKFFGLFNREGGAILPFKPSLFNSVSELGIDVHGRPFGDWFLYQVGVLNGPNEEFGDSNNQKDWYMMGRLDYAKSNLFSANISGFTYFGSNNAKVPVNEADVNWSRYGVAANVRYRMVDIYGAYTFDEITNLPGAMENIFDTTATGATIEADVIVTDRTLLSVRYDNIDAGGVLAMRKSSSILGFQAAYYLRPNIKLYVRDDFNLRGAEGGTSPVRQFRNALLLGADIAF